MKKVLFYLPIVLIISSCSSTSYTYRENYIDSNPIIATDVVVDLKVDFDNKIESVSGSRKTLEQAKAEAYYKAIAQNKIDVVVDPIFETTTESGFLFVGDKYSVKLMGFGAHYVNPRSKLEALKELKNIDTTDIHKFNYIYLGQSIPLKSSKVIGKEVKTTIASPESQPVKTEKEAPIKGNFGLKVGHFSDILTSENYGDYTDSGFAAGLFYDSNPNDKFGFKTELMYHSFTDSDFTYINIPVMAKYSFFRNFNVFAGPTVTAYLDNKDYLIKPVGLSLAVGAAFDLGKHFTIDYRYNHGLSELDDSGIDKAGHNSMTFGFGYRF
jgi:hypothetical protein